MEGGVESVGRDLVTSIVARSRQEAEGARGGAERLGENKVELLAYLGAVQA